MSDTQVLITLPQATQTLLAFSQKIGWVFRGQSNASWELIPKAGRPPFYRHSGATLTHTPRSRRNPPPDLGRFNHWRDLAAGYCEHLSENDFECLAFAQHYGLPTRLMDFTENALAALYFACESDFQVAGAVCVYHPEIFVDTEKADLYTLNRNACLRVPPFDRRLLAQRAAFLYFADPAAPLVPVPIEENVGKLSSVTVNLVKFVIPADAKLIIFRQLQDVGMTRRTLFPDLEGLSRDFVSNDLYLAAFNATR